MSRRRTAAALLLAAALAVAGLGLARAASPGGSATLQERVDAVAATIRCPTCQGLSIKDSPSVLADGSRQIVEQQLREGRTPDEVRQYFVDRYGPSAVLSPDPAGAGLLAWLLPAAALPLGGWLGWRRLRRAAPLSASAVEADEDATTALAEFGGGSLQPDGSPAGEALREALLVRLAAEEDAVGADARARADERLAAAYRRYARRATETRRPARALPRRTVTVVTVLALLAGSGAALAMGVRTRGASDLPTGDLPGAAAPGLSQLITATRERAQDPQGWIALGRAYDAGGELVQALRSYDRALALQPEADDVRLLRAAVLVRGGSIGEALPVLTELATRHPDDPDTLLVLGNAQDILERPEAETTLRRFLELAPDAPAADVVRERLAQR